VRINKGVIIFYSARSTCEPQLFQLATGSGGPRLARLTLLLPFLCLVPVYTYIICLSNISLCLARVSVIDHSLPHADLFSSLAPSDTSYSFAKNSVPSVEICESV
jgi:hypothetical protein